MCVDIAKFTPSCVAIFEAEGIAIEGLGSRAYGHRSQRSRSKRGGYRPKAEPKTKKLKWCTDSAKPARKACLRSRRAGTSSRMRSENVKMFDSL